MDGGLQWKTLFFNGWFGGNFPPIFGNIHIVSQPGRPWSLSLELLDPIGTALLDVPFKRRKRKKNVLEATKWLQICRCSSGCDVFWCCSIYLFYSRERSIQIVCVVSCFFPLLQPLSKGRVSKLVLGAVFMLQPILNLGIWFWVEVLFIWAYAL